MYDPIENLFFCDKCGCNISHDYDRRGYGLCLVCEKVESAAEHDRQEAEAETEDAEAEANCRSCGAGIGDGERYCQDCSDDHAESERERLRDLREGKQ